MMSRILITLLTAASSISAAALQIRQTSTADSITYCGSANTSFSVQQADLTPPGAVVECETKQSYIPCTKTSDPKSEVVFWWPYYACANATATNRFTAHLECYAELDTGDRYIAGHATGGLEPCWVDANLLEAASYQGPPPTCPGNSDDPRTCCEKKQLANCCDFRAQGQDLNGYLNETYLHCPY